MSNVDKIEGRRADEVLEPRCGALSVSDISDWRDGVLYPLAGGSRKNPARRFLASAAPAPHSFFFFFWFGATMELWAIGANNNAAAVELPGRRRQTPLIESCVDWQSVDQCLLWSRARARLGGAMPTVLDLLDRPGRCSGCWPHHGEVAGCAELSDRLIRLGGGAAAGDVAVSF